MSRAQWLWLGLFVALAGACAAGFAIQYGLASSAGAGGDTPLFSTFNAAHYALDYPRHGFVKRGLIGSLFAGLDPPARPIAIRVFNIGVLAGLAALLAGVLTACRPRLDTPSFWLLVTLWIAAPPAFINLGYDFGRYDHANLLLLAASLGCVARRRIAGLCVLTIAGLLIHEAYLFYALPLIGACLLARVDDGALPASACRRALIAVGTTGAATLWALWRWGRFEAGRTALAASVASRGGIEPNHNALNVWLRSFDETLGYVGRRWSEGLFGAGDIALYCGVAAVVVALLLGAYRSNACRPGMLALAPLGVLPLFALGVDYARWLALIWIVAAAVITVEVWRGRFARLLPARRALLGVLCLALSMLAGPIGTVHAFPLLRALIGIG